MVQTLTKIIKIDESAQGQRLDQWLAGQCGPELSRSRIVKLIRQGQVLLDGQALLEPRCKLPIGKDLELKLPPAEEAKPQGEAIALEILYEDEDIIVINKPVGLVVHPGNGNPTGTLVNALIYHCAQNTSANGGLSGIGGVKRPGIVHRLDKDTTGVMIVAKNDKAHLALSAQFADHGKTGVLVRRYQALVWGAPQRMKATIDIPLARAKHDRTRRAVASQNNKDARNAVTHYNILQKIAAKADGSALASLLQCQLETGRTHQIRVHMAHIGLPLIGDKVYGQAFKTKARKLAPEAQQEIEAFSRQALHAAFLRIEHPSTHEIMDFAAPLPQDMQNLIDVLAKEAELI